MIYILNAAVVTNYGNFRYRESSLEEVQEILDENEYICAIGHEATARLFNLTTGLDVSPNRIQVKMEPGDAAVVFWANRRLPEGHVVETIEELEEIGFTFGYLEMLGGMISLDNDTLWALEHGDYLEVEGAIRNILHQVGNNEG